MNWEAMRLEFEAITFLISGGAAMYVYMSKRHEASSKRISTRLENHETRISRVEASVGLAPTHSDITGLKEGLARLQAESSGQTELLRRLTTQVDRINEWLIDRAK